MDDQTREARQKLIDELTERGSHCLNCGNNLGPPSCDKCYDRGDCQTQFNQPFEFSFLLCYRAFCDEQCARSWKLLDELFESI